MRAGFTVAALGPLVACGALRNALGPAPAAREAVGDTASAGDTGLDGDTDTASADDTGSIGELSILTGTQMFSYAGTSLAVVGDEDGDGVDDLLVGVPQAAFAGETEGEAFLISGAGIIPGHHPLHSGMGAELRGERWGWAGDSLSGAGDVDGDGYADLLIGSLGATNTRDGEGATYLVLAPVSGLLSLADADAVSWGGVDEAGSAIAVAGAGDLDGDGALDLAIGAAGPGFGGVTFVVPAATPPALLIDSATALGDGPFRDWFGGTLSAGADVDGDGQADLWIGAETAQIDGVQGGAAYLYLGPVTGILGLGDADARVIGDQDSARLSTSLVGGADFDGDGYADPVMGASGESTGTRTSNGGVVLYTGPVSGTKTYADASASWTNPESYSGMGASLADAGDVDGDGNPDLLIGAGGYVITGGPATSGVAGLFLGPFSGASSFTDASFQMTPVRDSIGLGGTLTGPCDLGGDGIPDLVAGAPGNWHREDEGAAVIVTGGSW